MIKMFTYSSSVAVFSGQTYRRMAEQSNGMGFILNKGVLHFGLESLNESYKDSISFHFITPFSISIKGRTLKIAVTSTLTLPLYGS